jgi:imidazolonepropionase-like amidohydrolase
LYTGPGSANVLGGTFIAAKTVGPPGGHMLLKADNVAMKCAFGENPKRCYRDKGDSSRMTTAAKLREMLFKARSTCRSRRLPAMTPAKKPAFDIKDGSPAARCCKRRHAAESARPRHRGHLHRAAHRAGVWRKDHLEHVTEGHLIVEELARRKYRWRSARPWATASKFELRNKTFTTPGILAKAGCEVSIITDAPVIPQEYLPLCAGLAVKSGMDRFDALKAITINPARHAGIADRVGSLESRQGRRHRADRRLPARSIHHGEGCVHRQHVGGSVRKHL